MTSRRIVTVAVVAAALLCGTALHAQAPTGGRRMLPKKWVPIWRVGGTADDTLFGWVREHVANDKHVYILDAGTLQVHAFNAQTSQYAWSAGSKGSGPGQLARPVDIALTPQREVGVLDPGNGRVSIFDASGRYLRSIVSPQASVANSVCFLADGTALLSTFNSDSKIIRVNAQGKELAKWKFPWPLKNDANDFLHSTHVIRGGSPDRCVYGTTFGFGLFTIDVKGALLSFPFVEQVALPTFRQERLSSGGVATYLDKGDNAAKGGSRSGDTIVVSFGGSQIKGGVLDLYLQNGTYIGSWPEPPEDRLFYINGRIYGLSTDATQKLRVWADTADTTRVLTEMGFRQPRSIKRPVTPRANTTARRPTPVLPPPPTSR
ncbi:6-bladed beta-propeller [Gemmatimonas sp.]|uniref:6-bladed beta-propeller n=1 Tax=Gemmatimonas sp. TaxID=1962908 RepID=UPI003340CEBB